MSIEDKPTPEQMEKAATFFLEHFQNRLDADPSYRNNCPNAQIVRALCVSYQIDQKVWNNS